MKAGFEIVRAPELPSPLHRKLLIGVALVGMLACSGCISMRITKPAKSASEQILLTEAATRAVRQLTFEPLRGLRIFVDDSYLDTPEKQFLLGELRARLLLAGGQVAATRADSQVVLEVRSGGVGIDQDGLLIGVPAFKIWGADSDVATPEVAVFKNVRQQGLATVAFVAYWSDNGEVAASSGPFTGRTLREDYWICGWGPRTVGDIPTAGKP